MLDDNTDSGALLVVAPKDVAVARESTQWDIYPIDGNEELTDGGLVQLVNVKSRMCMNVSGSYYHELIQYSCQPSAGTYPETAIGCTKDPEELAARISLQLVIAEPKSPSCSIAEAGMRGY